MIAKVRAEKGLPDPNEEKQKSPLKVGEEDEMAKLETAKNAMEKKIRD